MKLKIEDSVFDYEKAVEDLGLVVKHKMNVPMHVVELHIEDWPIELTNSLRFVLFKLYPTTRLEAKIVKCTDTRMFAEYVENRLNSIVLSSKCPTKALEYEIVHNLDFDGPLNITLEETFLEKFMNRSIIAVLGKGRIFNIKGETVTSCGLDKNNTNYDFVQAFDRKDLVEYKKDGVFYNKGICRFTYHDDTPASQVLKTSFNILRDMINTVKGDMDKYLTVSVETPMLSIPRDRSGIVAFCVKHYVYKNGSEQMKCIQQAITDDYETNSSITYYHLGELSMVKKSILVGLDKLLADISSLSHS